MPNNRPTDEFGRVLDENKSCKTCGRFYINNQACYQKCGEAFILWIPDNNIPTDKSCAGCVETNATICAHCDGKGGVRDHYSYSSPPPPTPNKMIEVEADKVFQDLIDLSPLASPRFMSMLSLPPKEQAERVAELSAKIKQLKTNAFNQLQPAIQSYVEKEIASRDLIHRKDAVKHVEIDEREVLSLLTNLSLKIELDHYERMLLANTIVLNITLKLRQQEVKNEK